MDSMSVNGASEDEIMEDVEDQDPEDIDEDDDDNDKSDDGDEGEGEDDDGGDDQAEDQDDDEGDNDDDAQAAESRSRSRSQSVTQAPVRPLPTLRPNADIAQAYEIVPYVAAPQSTSINACCATPCMRWLFTGGTDGYIRKYDWFASMNGKLALTVAQKHPYVDSVTRAGVLLSYWENEETVKSSSLLQIPDTTDDLKLSPVYSLAVQSQALWLLSGTESGGINLQTVRHDEGKIITTLRKHTSAVSVLTLADDEKTVLSGSWDRNVCDWDLNTGQVLRDFTSPAGQISSVSFRPYTSGWENIRTEPLMNGVSGATVRQQNNGTNGGEATEDAASPAGSDRSFGSLFGDDEDMGMPGAEDEMNSAIVNGVDVSNEAPSQADTDTAMADSTGPSSSTNANNQSAANGASTPPASSTLPPSSSSDQNVFLASSMDGTLRLWDRRMSEQITTSFPTKGVPPWCMSAVWSVDGNWIYAGRRNSTVEEYSIHRGLAEPTRTLKFPNGSGSVSSLATLPNGRNLICASFDNLRCWDLKEEQRTGRGAGSVPFTIVPGHHGGVISNTFIDKTCRYIITTGGNRGWEGTTTEVFLGYEIELKL